MDPSNSGTNVTGLVDDTYTNVIDIGFDFCFYGNMFDQLVISTNNYVTFDLTVANNYSNYNTWPIPNANAPFNAILGPWMDLNPNNGGSLYYNVYGDAISTLCGFLENLIFWIELHRFAIQWSNQIV